MDENDTTQIGWFCNDSVICPDCAKEMMLKAGEIRLVAIYRINIGPYKQTCHTCKKVLVEGRTPAWCELFPAAPKK